MATSKKTSPKRPFDLVLYGASGFVGAQTVAYIAAHAPANLKWALCGRNLAKLEATRAAIPGAAGAAVLVADAQDREALAKVASQTRVVLSTAGPFALYGSGLVQACVDHGTHYCDITGETPWVRQLIDAHHDDAVTSGTRIVPFCGFDSIPSDIGVHLLISAMREQWQQDCVHVKSAFTLGGGGFNGGTVQSFMTMMDQGQSGAINDLFLLNPLGSRPPNERAHADVTGPRHDKDFDAWVGPFIMGQINTRVVRRADALRRSAAGLPNTQALVYQETMRFGRGAAAGVITAAFSAGSVATQGLMAIGPLRRLANRFTPQAGEGPSEARMDAGFFKCELFGTAADGRRMRAVVSDQGDAGNRATTKFVCESALALAVDGASLPGGGGVIPPSIAMGDVIVARLRAAGMRLEVAPV